MADRKISDLTALTTPASGDFLPIVDISEAAAASKNKRITIEELMRGVPDGTAAAPGIAFETDPNTGIYSPGADQLAVATNGTERLTVNTAATTSTLPVVHPLGAVGTPSITFTGDLNTGFWSPTADTLAASTAGSERVRITSAGRVGIGNSSPAELLDVSGAIKHGSTGYIADGDLGFIYTGTNNSTYGTVIGTKPGTTYGTSRNFTVSLNPATGPGREVFRIVGQSGRVGIGTSAPAAKTEIRQDGSSAVELLRLVNDDTSGAGSTIQFKNFYNSALISSTSNPGFSQGGTLRLQTFNGNGVLNTGLAMDNQGRVGIGTTGPSAPLHVLNSSGGEIRAASSAGAELTIWEGGGVSGNPDTTRIGVGRNNTSLIFQNTSGPARNAFAIGTSGAVPLILSTSNLERARIDSSGRLLVGTSTASVTATQILQGNSGAASGNGKLIFARGTTSPADGLGLGEIAFSDSSHSSSVTILATRDGGTWTSGASQPTRLVFSTTSNSASSPTERLRITSAGVLQIADAGNITVGTTTGTKIGTATTQKLGFYNATPVVQPTAVADATDAATVITQLNDLLAKLRTLGIIAT
jgi:hypothetical protein